MPAGPSGLKVASSVICLLPDFAQTQTRCNLKGARASAREPTEGRKSAAASCGTNGERMGANGATWSQAKLRRRPQKPAGRLATRKL